MRILSCFFRLNNYITYFLSRPPPAFVMLLYLSYISGGYFMDYLKRYKKMISLRGLTNHTMKSYQTYISAYLDHIENTLHKTPSQVSYKDLRRFIEVLQKKRNLSDRTINVAISQLRFFTLYAQDMGFLQTLPDFLSSRVLLLFAFSYLFNLLYFFENNPHRVAIIITHNMLHEQFVLGYQQTARYCFSKLSAIVQD